jgi:5-formyltetrahydrofolate cyclo-ligase
MKPQTKNALRKELRLLRDSFSEGFMKAAAVQAAEKLIEKWPDSVSKIMLYAPIKSEISTVPLFHWAIKNHIQVAFPRLTEGSPEMEPVLVESWDQLVLGPYSIPQPSDDFPAVSTDEIEMVIVPGIAFDRSGYRLGYGAGYYDRFLKRLPSALWIGFTYQRLVLPGLPVEPHDINVHRVVTELMSIPCKEAKDNLNSSKSPSLN